MNRQFILSVGVVELCCYIVRLEYFRFLDKTGPQRSAKSASSGVECWERCLQMPTTLEFHVRGLPWLYRVHILISVLKGKKRTRQNFMNVNDFAVFTKLPLRLKIALTLPGISFSNRQKKTWLCSKKSKKRVIRPKKECWEKYDFLMFN